MFGIHPGFTSQAFTGSLLPLIFAGIGCAVLVVAVLAFIHGRRMGNAKALSCLMSMLLLFGGFFLFIGVCGCYSTIHTYQLASRLIAEGHPQPAMVTIKVVATRSERHGTAGRRSRRGRRHHKSTIYELYAAIRPQKPGAFLAHDYLELNGVNSSNKPDIDIENQAGEVYYPADARTPIVISVKGKYWCADIPSTENEGSR